MGNPLLMMSLLGDDSAMDSDLLMLMMMGGQGMGQMNPLMLSMLLDNEPDYDRTKLEKICDDAGVDCTAHLEAIFQPIETDKPKDCTGDDACAKAVKDAYDAIMKNKKSDMSDLLLLSMLGGQGKSTFVDFFLKKSLNFEPYLIRSSKNPGPLYIFQKRKIKLRYGRYELHAPTSPHEGRFPWR